MHRLTQRQRRTLSERLLGAVFCLAHPEYGLTYQSCRFCHRGARDTSQRGLWKYQVRHYICRDCVADIDPTLTVDRVHVALHHA